MAILVISTCRSSGLSKNPTRREGVLFPVVKTVAKNGTEKTKRKGKQRGSPSGPIGRPPRKAKRLPHRALSQIFCSFEMSRSWVESHLVHQISKKLGALRQPDAPSGCRRHEPASRQFP